MQFMQVHDAIQLIQMEYHEMVDLALTSQEAQRLCNLSSELCERALASLTASGFLHQAKDGSYVRVRNDSGGTRLHRDPNSCDQDAVAASPEPSR